MANAQRQYESATVFNARCIDMRYLWTPSTEYKGQQQQKPNYFGGFILPKQAAHWSQDPGMSGVMAAFGKLLQGQFSAYASNPMAAGWPIADGDAPGPDGKVSEFAKGHWLFYASSGNPPGVELVQAGGALAKLSQRVHVKPGDFCTLGVTAAVNKNDGRRVKFYLNAVVFTHPGEEIVFANSVSGAELMKMAEAQGLRPVGFNPAGNFAPQGGGFNPAGNFAPQGGGFAPQGGAPVFTPGGAPGAPMNPNGFAGPATAPNGAGFGGGAAFPSNGAPPAQPGGWSPPQSQGGGFAPGAFTPPQGPFGNPQR